MGGATTQTRSIGVSALGVQNADIAKGKEAVVFQFTWNIIYVRYAATRRRGRHGG